MEFDATTYLLEIVNFLALLWLLTHFLYRPARAALAAREEQAARAAQALADRRAELDRRDAELARDQAELLARREDAQHRLAEEIAAQRQERLAALARELQDEGTKARARLAQEQAAARTAGEARSRQQAAAFVGRYLARLASPALESALVALFLADLQAQADRVRPLLQGDGGAPGTATVTTAFELAPPLRVRVEQALSACAGHALPLRWQPDPTLLAGIRVDLAGHRLEASLQQGVDAFAAPAAGT